MWIFILGAVLGIGVSPIVQHGWNLFWGYLATRWGWNVSEAEWIRGLVSLALIIIVGFILYRHERNAKKNDDAERRAIINKLGITPEEIDRAKIEPSEYSGKKKAKGK